MAEFSFKNVNVEHFIDEIKKRPAIWDVNTLEYHDLTKKRRAWIQIFREFYAEFDQSKNKYEIATKFMNKWNDIKNLFLRLSRSGRSLYYPYAQQLSFLQTSGIKIDKELVIDPEKLEKLRQSPTNSVESKLDSKKRKCESTNIKNVRRHSRQRNHDFESSLIFKNTPIYSSAMNLFVEPNSDRIFFESIMPSISDFTEDERLEFRSEIINAIKGIRKKRDTAEKVTENDSKSVTESEYESS